jgi:hypothetical protein
LRWVQSEYMSSNFKNLLYFQANATLLVALGPHAAEEKQKIMDKLASLDTSLHNLSTQINKISEKLRLDQFAEISEHFLQFKMISSEIADKYTEFQGALSYVINDLELAVLLAINGIVKDVFY